jgi:arginase
VPVPTHSTVQIHLVGLPTDRNSSFERGASLGPAAIREALWSDRGNLACENGMEIGTHVGCDILLHDLNDVAMAESLEDHARIRAAVASSLISLADQAARQTSAAVPICLGGDHSVSFPILEAIAAHHGPVTILHFDAHPDLYDNFDNNPYSHASPFARILENRLASRLVQVGIRTLNKHCRAQVARFGVEVIEMRHFSVERVPVLTGPVYISVDLDGIDPAYAPGVAHPEPGGLSVRELLAVLDRVRAPIVGADIVELNPLRDVGGVTAILAAKLVRELASLAVRNNAA